MSAEIGHELNNYLAVIYGHTDLLLGNKDLQGIDRAKKSLQAISDQIRKVERFTAGLMDLGLLRSKREDSDVNQLLEKLVQLIQGQSRFRRTEFILEADADLPHLEIDPGQFKQVLLNLYANASDAMGEGRVTTRTGYCKDKNQVVVEDNGPGMPEEVRECISTRVPQPSLPATGLDLQCAPESWKTIWAPLKWKAYWARALCLN